MGSVQTDYVKYGNTIDKDTILPKTIDATMLSFSPMIGIASKNLFNKSTAMMGYYVGGNGDGDITPNALYNASDFIPVVAGQTYVLKFINMVLWFKTITK